MSENPGPDEHDAEDFNLDDFRFRLSALMKGRQLVTVAKDANVKPSYLSELMRGRGNRGKPTLRTRTRLAKALGVNVEELTRSPEELAFLKQLPNEVFVGPDAGVQQADIVEMLRSGAAAGSALARTISEVTKLHGLHDEELVRTMLRIYQGDLYDRASRSPEGSGKEDELAEAEREATYVRYELMERYGWPGAPAVEISVERREAILHQFLTDGMAAKAGGAPFLIDTAAWPREEVVVDGRAVGTPLAGHKSYFVSNPGGRHVLFLNPRLQAAQRLFIYAREIGFFRLGLTGQGSALYPPPRKTEFSQLKASFLANYFAGALLLPRAWFLADVRDVLARPSWNPEAFLRTFRGLRPEVGFYRFIAIARDRELGQHGGAPESTAVGVGGSDEGGLEPDRDYSFNRRTYARTAVGSGPVWLKHPTSGHQAWMLPSVPRVTKTLAQFGGELQRRGRAGDRVGYMEHPCMLFGGVQTIAELLRDERSHGEGGEPPDHLPGSARLPAEGSPVDLDRERKEILVHAQISTTTGLKYHDPKTAPRFLVLSMAYPLHARADEVASVSFALRLDGPGAPLALGFEHDLPEETVATSCERCGRTGCALRRAKPTILNEYLRRKARGEAEATLEQQAKELAGTPEPAARGAAHPP